MNDQQVVAQLGDLREPARGLVCPPPLLLQVSHVTRLPQGVSPEGDQGQRTDERSLTRPRRDHSRSRSRGMVMQCGPPRARDSSSPGTVTTVRP